MKIKKQFPQIRGTYGGAHKKGYSVCGFYVGSLRLWKISCYHITVTESSFWGVRYSVFVSLIEAAKELFAVHIFPAPYVLQIYSSTRFRV